MGCVVAKVNGELWDLDRPFEGDAKLELLKFEDEEGQYVFWHSSAHVLGEAMERCYGCNLCYGPPIDQGFYYDMWTAQDHKVSDNDFKAIEDLTKSIVKEKQPFERLTMTKSDLLEMFKYNEYAKEIVTMMKAGGFCVEADVDNGNTMNKKVRNAQLAQFNFIFVVGEKEQSNRTVNVRTRDNKVHGEFTLDAVVAKFNELATEMIIKSEEHGWSEEVTAASEKSKSSTPMSD